MLLDGLLRVSVPHQAAEIPRLLAVPATIGRLDVFTTANDCMLTAGSQRIELSSVPGVRGPGGRGVASFADGRVVVQMDGMHAAVMGSLAPDGSYLPATGGIAARKPLVSTGLSGIRR